MNGIFLDLQSQVAFHDFVVAGVEDSRHWVTDWFPSCALDIDASRVQYAHGEYCQAVSKFSVLLHSKNPDHYKRAGGLLHALYQSEIITGLDLGAGKLGSLEDLEAGFTMVSYGDAQHVLKFTEFFSEFHNQILAFELSYRCCCMYEDNYKKINFDYLQNVCRYLKANSNLNVDSCFMIFKSLMV